MNFRAAVARPLDRGKYVAVAPGVFCMLAGPDDTRVKCLSVVVELDTSAGAGSTIDGALSDRDREARLLPADGDGECSGEGVLTRTKSP